MNKLKIQEFFIKAREKTYASGDGKVEPLLPGSVQYEYKEGEFLYRDIYNIGNGVFMGLETVYYQEKPVLSMSYFGNFKALSEEEVDGILRKALTENSSKTRLWEDVSWKFENYEYSCKTDSGGSIDEFSGSENILKNGDQVYYLYYAGGFLRKLFS